MRRPNSSAVWRHSTESAHLAGVHFHDLRHAGNDFAASTRAPASLSDGADGSQLDPGSAALPAPDPRTRPDCQFGNERTFCDCSVGRHRARCRCLSRQGDSLLRRSFRVADDLPQSRWGQISMSRGRP